MNSWYATLDRPPLTPPNWIFAPVWSVLYGMIAVAIFLYFKQTRSSPHWMAIGIMVVHLVANIAWTPIFFRAERPGWALVDILILDVTLVWIIWHFWQTCRPSSMLLWPYFAWVSFATYLNAGFYFLNRR